MNDYNGDGIDYIGVVIDYNGSVNDYNGIVIDNNSTVVVDNAVVDEATHREKSGRTASATVSARTRRKRWQWLSATD